MSEFFNPGYYEDRYLDIDSLNRNRAHSKQEQKPEKNELYEATEAYIRCVISHTTSDHSYILEGWPSNCGADLDGDMFFYLHSGNIVPVVISYKDIWLSGFRAGKKFAEEKNNGSVCGPGNNKKS